jgi:hypothetical protein
MGEGGVTDHGSPKKEARLIGKRDPKRDRHEKSKRRVYVFSGFEKSLEKFFNN